MTKMTAWSVWMAISLSSVALADGPCGDGNYVFRCSVGRCGLPSSCGYVCDGPSVRGARPASGLAKLAASAGRQVEDVARQLEGLKDQVFPANMCK